MAERTTHKSFSEEIDAEVARAIAGGVGRRLPCNCMPANPTADHQVAFELGDVRSAARRANAAGATWSEIAAAADV